MAEVRVILISALTPSSTRVKIRARVWKLWNAQQAGATPFGINFVLIDDEGKDGAIQGFAATPVARKLPPWFAEGKICEFGRFTVRAGEGFRSVGHEYTLVFGWSTLIRALPDDTALPLYYFEFKHLEDVGSSVLPQGAVLDVLAIISAFGPVQDVVSSGAPARVQTIYIANEKGFTAEVALWENYINSFDSAAIVEQSRVAPVIVAFSGLQVKKFRVMGLKTFAGTRVFIDPPVVEVSHFRSLLPSSLPAVVIHGAVAGSDAALANPLPIVGVPPRRVSLAELIGSTLEGRKFECIVQIVRLVDHFGWIYPACPTCYHRVDENDDNSSCGYPDCSRYKQVLDPLRWYRVAVQVSDDKDEAEFVLLGRQAELVIGKTVEELLVEEKDNACEDDVPPSLLQIVGKEYLFTVSIKRSAGFTRRRNFAVSRVAPVPADHRLLQFPVSSSNTFSPKVSVTTDIPESSSAQEFIEGVSTSEVSSLPDTVCHDVSVPPIQPLCNTAVHVPLVVGIPASKSSVNDDVNPVSSSGGFQDASATPPDVSTSFGERLSTVSADISALSDIGHLKRSVPLSNISAEPLRVCARRRLRYAVAPEGPTISFADTSSDPTLEDSEVDG